MAYIGNIPLPQATEARTSHTVTAGESPKTSFNVQYVPSYLDVFINGVLQDPATDYTATNGTSVTLTSGAVTGDIVSFIARTQTSALVALPLKDSQGNNVLSESGGVVTLANVNTATIGSTAGSSNSKIILARQNYYQVHVAKDITSTTNCLSIVFPGTDMTSLIVRSVTNTNAPGNNAFARISEIYVIKYSSGSLTATTKLSSGDADSNTVTVSISGNSVILAFPYVATVGTQNCRSYFEIMGIYGSSSESAFTVNIL